MNEPSGVLVLDKRAGISSARAIAEVKRRLGLRKIGHAGTLDPGATGILVCLINKATKSARIFEGGQKTYEGTIRFGFTTVTDDVAGDIITESNLRPSFHDVLTASKNFIGTISQTPPAISAIKVNGARAYDIVRREGRVPELKSRLVTVDAFEIAPHDSDSISFRIVCSSGTYIRSIARDCGALLGCGGVLASLRRTGSSPFTINHARNIETICVSDIIPIETFDNLHSKETSCHRLS